MISQLKMMNVLVLSLVLTSLATAGVLSPKPVEKKHYHEDVIVKEGHRVVVVEYDKDHGGNTKISIISPPPHDEEYSENIPAAAAEKKESGKMDAGSYFHSMAAAPKELVCDAFGKCKHSIASAFERKKDAAAEKAHEAYEAEEGAREAVTEAAKKARDTVADKGNKAAKKAYEAEEGVRETITEAAKKARDAVVDKGNKAAKMAYEAEEGARDAVTDQLEKARAKVADIGHGTAEKAEAAKEMAKDSAEKVKDTKGDVQEDASRKMEHMKREVSEKAGEKVGEAKETAKLKNISTSVARAFGVANLVGIAIAYGMCVWVTFVSSYVLARALPRQQFAVVQSKIYPVYFRAMAYSIGMGFLGHLMSHRQRMQNSNTSAEMLLGSNNLLFSLAVVLVNLLYLEPRATKVMFERMKMEKEEGRGKGTNNIHTDPVDWVTGAAGSRLDSTGGAPPATTKSGESEKKQQERAVVEGTTAAKAEIIRLSKMLKKLNSYSSFLNVVTLMSLTLYIANLAHYLHTPC